MRCLSSIDLSFDYPVRDLRTDLREETPHLYYIQFCALFQTMSARVQRSLVDMSLPISIYIIQKYNVYEKTMRYDRTIKAASKPRLDTALLHDFIRCMP